MPATFDKDSGDLGLGYAHAPDVITFSIMTRAIAPLLRDLAQEFPDKYFRYGITLSAQDHDAIQQLTYVIPDAKFYQTDGRRIFKIRGTDRMICYLVSGPGI